MKQLQEIYEIERHGIAVTVKIDYKQGKISLVEYDTNKSEYVPKRWLFAEREIEYVNSWQNILEAMQFAIADATRRLELHQKDNPSMLERVLISELEEETEANTIEKGYDIKL